MISLAFVAVVSVSPPWVDAQKRHECDAVRFPPRPWSKKHVHIDFRRNQVHKYLYMTMHGKQTLHVWYDGVRYWRSKHGRRVHLDYRRALQDEMDWYFRQAGKPVPHWAQKQRFITWRYWY